MAYEAVIGLEIHAELMTAAKMFSRARVVDSVTAAPNTAVRPLCLGMPGTLPVINREAVGYALRVALALNCTINQHNVFARKNYFYPDLPKGYQISQYEEPIGVNGWLDVTLEDGQSKRIRIRRVHMEEDTGKLTHQEDDSSLVDYNRAGVPLLEIVTEPDIRSGEEARLLGMKVRGILRYLRVNSGDMEKGVLRMEPNISIRPQGSDELNTRTELKNLNSFRVLADGTAHEIARQIAVVESGGAVVQETRGWHDARRETFSQRVKEEAEDYRYFPEPDLPPLFISEEWIAETRAALPELADARRARYQADFGLGDYEAGVLTDEREVAEWFETAVAAGGSPQAVAKWMINELFRLLNEQKTTLDQTPLAPDQLVALIKLVDDSVINNNSAKEVLAEMFANGGDPAAIVEARGLGQISDTAALEALVAEVLAANGTAVERYRAGETKLRGFFVGQVMRASKGQANPGLVNKILQQLL